MPSISRSNRQATGRSLSFDQRFPAIDHSMVEIQTGCGEEEQRLFRGEIATPLVSRRGHSARQSESERLPAL